jgi:general secretion pathway protein I
MSATPGAWSRCGRGADARVRGFTLLEVMLAFVLLATAMGLLIAMLSNGLHQVRQAQSETEASLHAQSLLDQIGVLEAIVPGQSRGEFDQGRYRYELEITETSDPAPAPESTVAAGASTTLGAPRIYRVALAVTWGAGQPAQRLNFVTLRARAPPANAVASP